MEYPLFALGLILLIKGADFFVEGSSAISRLLRIPSVVIGLTIVAMGTSAPEASVSITAALNSSNDIALGNVLGSNLFNLLFIVGICAVIKTSTADRSILARDLPVSIGATALILLFALDGKITLAEGLISVLLMAAYLSALVVPALRAAKRPVPVSRDLLGDARFSARAETPSCPVLPAGKKARTLSWFKNLLYIGGGLTAVIFGGQFVVNSAVKIASDLGLSQSVIGLTVVAIGTSLPELVTSIAAARKGDSGMALGNVVGSNIFNLLFILGISSSLHPISVDAYGLIDCALLLSVSVGALFFFTRSGRIGKACGWTFLLLYVAYTAFILLRM